MERDPCLLPAKWLHRTFDPPFRATDVASLLWRVFGVAVPVQSAASSHTTVTLTARPFHVLGFLDPLQRTFNNGLKGHRVQRHAPCRLRNG